MEETQRLEIAARITELRERGPFNQPTIADRLGITLRAYQKVEAKGTTSFDRCEELAEIHREWTGRSRDYAHVDATWIWDGRRKGDTPDLMAELNGGSADLAELRELVLETLQANTEQLSQLLSTVAALEGQVQALGQEIRDLREASGE